MAMSSSTFDVVGCSSHGDMETITSTEIWRESPIFKGTTKFETLPDVKNILVTGGEGFIASWLIRHLVLTYPAYKVVSFDNLDTPSSLNNTAVLNGESNFHFVNGDITNPEQVKSSLQEHLIDTVFHFAAQSHVDLSFGNSYQFTNTNVYGTHVLLECSKAVGVRRFIHVSTDEVYGEVEAAQEDLIESSLYDILEQNFPVRVDSLAPTNPYSATKAAAEMLVNAYWKSWQLPVIIVRSNNVYGPHQFPEKVIPKFICLLEKGRKLLVHGDGRNTRRYLYAADAVDAFDTILHKGSVSQVYNVSSQDEISNLELCRKLLSAFSIANATEEEFAAAVQHTKDRPFNDMRYAVDGTKLQNLGWQQKMPFSAGLAITVDWYRRFGSSWWGDISRILTPFPVIDGGQLFTEEEHDARNETAFYGPRNALAVSLASDVAPLTPAQTP